MSLLETVPEDLVSFLQRGDRLRYDVRLCEAGAVTLLPRERFVVQLFSTDVQGSANEAADPHRGELGCYLVPAVDLVASAGGGYEPTGLLIWLPCERRFGTWDSSHPLISVFRPDVSWTRIAASPAQFINAQWEGAFEDSAPTEPLVPWPRHAYSAAQVYEPLPMTADR